MFRNISLFIVFFLLVIGAQAQSPGTNLYNNQRFTTIVPNSDTIRLDSLTIIPGSFSITGVDSSRYLLDPMRSILVWKDSLSTDTFYAHYRVFPFSLSKRFYHKNPDHIEQHFLLAPISFDVQGDDSRNLIEFGALDYSGSFGRAVSFGNNQDVVLNSNFNLQLDGYLGDSILIEAAITDNNIPFQPEGNTQQIQEFDKVYLTFSKRQHKLTVGDYEMFRPEGYFMNFYKRVQGLAFSSGASINKDWSTKGMVSGSVAKGRFTRNVLTPQDGNQGPYKLVGANGESFFIILAGSEKVYIDGQQVKRGADQDYIIDYNSAEVTFMPRRLITKDLRVVVEFEYSDRNFLNSLFFLNNHWDYKNKLSLYLNAYSNQDAKNQGYVQQLTGEQKQFLASVGDNYQQALFPSIKPDTFAANKVLYKLVDTVVNGVLYDSVLVYSTNADSAKYNAVFSYVGPGKGSYNQVSSSVNGRVYEWVAPVNGFPMGSYAAVTLLVTPKMQQMFIVGGNYNIDKDNRVFAEVGMTHYDPNLYSTINNNQHLGGAARLGFQSVKKLRKTDKYAVELLSGGQYEFVQSKFTAIERFRNVEFNRDWSIVNQPVAEDENLASAKVGLRKTNLGSLQYEASMYTRGNTYKGLRNAATLQFAKAGFSGMATGSLMQSSTDTVTTSYFRPNGFVEKTFPKLKGLTVGGKYLLEHNETRNTVADTLSASSFSFNTYTGYINNGTQSKNPVGLEYMVREDRKVRDNQFRDADKSQTISLNAAWLSNEHHQIRFTGSYRKLDVLDSALSGQKADESVLGRFEYTVNEFKGFLTATSLYEFGSGQEQKREYTYVQVPAGQGQFAWRDYNNDGVQQLNEFELAIFPDEAKFIRIFVPSNQYVKANFVTYSQTLGLNFAALFNRSDKRALLRFIGRFYNSAALQLSNRLVANKGLEQFNPFFNDFNDINLITNTTSLTNSFMFNRASPVWGVDYIYQQTGGKSLLTYGLESRLNKENQLKLRWNFTKNFSSYVNGRIGERSSTAEATQDFANKNYYLNYYSLEPSLSFSLKSIFRTSFTYRYDDKKNTPAYGGEKAMIHSLISESRYNVASTSVVSLKLTYASIQFNGNTNTTVGYIMLDGLQNGTNVLWSLNLDRRLAKSLELSFQYEGRKPGTNPVVHIGRASVRAVF